MRRSGFIFAAILSATLALAPALAQARAGDGYSFGSRGMRSYMLPPGTGTAPYGASPLQRSLTPNNPGYSAPGYGAPGYGYGSGYGRRSPFVSGLMGGLIGAGLGGLLFGRGLFGGMHGFGGFFGLLLQIFLLVWLARWLVRRFLTPAMAGGGLFNRMGMPGGAVPPPRAMPLSGIPAGRAIQVLPADYQAFEQLLRGVQQAWSNHDLNALRSLATPEIVSYFAEQLGEQTSRGVRNMVTDVRLEHGDLAEAWAEDGREYATVAMRFSMIDVTRDLGGRVVDGSLAERIAATEIWTFMRAPGGRWILSAIQQAR
jgi:predicted lipid-binding transport protein (Tim44 family)